jgi:hypothetical protein
MACGCKWQSRKYRGISIILVFAVSTAFGAYGWICKLKLPTWVFHAWLIRKKSADGIESVWTKNICSGVL